MFGFGLNSEVRGIAKTLVNEINNLYNVDIISIDIPTGLNPDTGIPYGEVIRANKTVTLTAVKQAFLNDHTETCCPHHERRRGQPDRRIYRES